MRNFPGANIIIPELKINSQVSINLKNVNWQSALQSILDTYDYELYQRVSESEVYSVRPRPEGSPEPQMSRNLRIEICHRSECVKTDPPAAAGRCQDIRIASRNMIVVKSNVSSLREIRAVLESIDTVRQQVYIESKFMELSDDAQKDLGIDWEVLRAYSAGTSGETDKDDFGHNDRHHHHPNLQGQRRKHIRGGQRLYRIPTWRIIGLSLDH